MPYDVSDVRSTLSATTVAPKGATFAPQTFSFNDLPPDESSVLGSRTWWVRSQSGIVAYTKAVAGDRFDRTEQSDEYGIILGPHTALTISAETTVAVVGEAVVFVPPGDSSVVADLDCVLVRVFSAQSDDLVAKCRNSAVFAAASDPNVASWAPWPAPVGGYRIRVYPLSDVPVDPNRFGRIFRCSTVMINMLPRDPGPRNTAKLSPHHHDDFEQLSLQMEGDYIHHLRTPWTPDMSAWRDDEHAFCTSPGLAIIPPPLVHTSAGVGDHAHQLVDIFCPPRFDFSAKPGWVLNADDYPMPD